MGGSTPGFMGQSSNLKAEGEQNYGASISPSYPSPSGLFFRGSSVYASSVGLVNQGLGG